MGASNWGGSVKQIQSIFFHTTINWAMADCIACDAATPNPHGTASSQHYGRRPNASVLSESTVGASNWGGSVKQIKSIFLHTTINWAMADFFTCGAATPNPHDAASSQHYGRCPNASVLSESMVGASNWGGSAEAN